MGQFSTLTKKWKSNERKHCCATLVELPQVYIMSHVVHHKLRTTSIILKNAMQGDLLQKELKKHLEETLKEEMGGIQRIPAMMFFDQEKNTG